MTSRIDALTSKVRALPEPRRSQVVRELDRQGLGTTTFTPTIGQSAMLFLEQLSPGIAAYRIHERLAMTGPLDVTAFAGAWDDVVDRHEALRTTFSEDRGTLSATVHRFGTVPLVVADVAADELEQRAQEVFGLPLDPDANPVRAHLLRVSPTEHHLLLAMHHLCCDGRSVKVFSGELAGFYLARTGGPRFEPDALPIQYSDWAAWQAGELTGPRLAADVAWWVEELAGAPATVELPTDHPRPATQRYRGNSAPLRLDADTVTALDALATACGATRFMATLAGFAAHISRLSGQTDLVIGVPTSGRWRTEAEPLVGFFVSMLPVRIDLSGSPTFRQLVDRVRTACLRAHGHDRVPLESIVGAVQRSRDMSRAPLFQICFSLQPNPMAVSDLGGTRMERRLVPVTGARFDLEAQAFDHGDHIEGWFEYDTDLFTAATMADRAGQLAHLVAGLVAEPDRPIDEAGILPAAQEQAIAELECGPVVDWPQGLLPELITASLQADPAAIAVVCDDLCWTRAELDERSARLAAWLQSQGVGRGSRVGVCLDRSPELVCALWGVVRAGAAFTPLTTDLPPARIGRMLAGADGVLCAASQAAMLAGSGVPVWPLEQAHAPTSGLVEPELAAADPVYVTYTSGSTGEPKGVVNTHGGLLNRIRWMQDAFGLGPGDRVLQKTPITFDVSVWEFFWPLMAGVPIVVLPPEAHRDPRAIAAAVVEHSVTTMHFVPSMLVPFLPEVAGCPGLRRIICSGEALQRSSVVAVQAAGTEIHNLYGPTEAAIDVTWWPCPPDESGPVPIGRPIANTQTLVLDDHGHRVPLGVEGELVLGGDNIALGYLARPDLTADRFVPDTFHTTSTGWLYRTGDRARMTRDGVVHFLGRRDGQVKLRGQRLELEEIESVLAGLPGVQGAAAAVHTSGLGDERLVGYLVGSELDDDQLRAGLSEQLPDYMLPNLWVHLDELPLTASGKLNRGALARPDAPAAGSRAVFVAARDDTEQVIADIWSEVLGVEQVGVDDGFFELGGHSLLLLRVRDELATRLGAELTMIDLFRYPTVATLAAHLRSGDQPTDVADVATDRANQRRAARQRRTGAKPSTKES